MSLFSIVLPRLCFWGRDLIKITATLPVGQQIIVFGNFKAKLNTTLANFIALRLNCVINGCVLRRNRKKSLNKPLRRRFSHFRVFIDKQIRGRVMDIKGTPYIICVITPRALRGLQDGFLAVRLIQYLDVTLHPPLIR